MPGSQLSVELVKSCDRFYRKLKHSGEKTIAGNVRSLFSQDSLVDIFIMHFSNFYQKFSLSLITSEKACNTAKAHAGS